jgi:hypothetical protein
MVNSGVDDLYEPVEPYDFGELEVGDGQTLYWETVGTPHGLPAVGLHGGPRSGSTPDARRHFDPSVYRAVLFVALCANLLHSSMNTGAELRSTIRCRSPRRDQVSGPSPGCWRRSKPAVGEHRNNCPGLLHHVKIKIRHQQAGLCA